MPVQFVLLGRIRLCSFAINFFLSFHLCSILVPPLFPSRPGQTQSKLICFHLHTRAADNHAHCKPLFCRQIQVLLPLYTGAFASRLIIA
jgi:hypothetical protein